MSITGKVTAAVAVIALAGVGGYSAARALSTDGPDPSVDSPVVVRPANDSGSSDDKGDRGSENDSRGKRSDDRGRGNDDRGQDDRDHDSGSGSDDNLEPAHPTPNRFDDDDDDSGHGSDDDGGDDDGGDDERDDD